jgi:hypothetical protein
MAWSKNGEDMWSSVATALRPAIARFIRDGKVRRHVGHSGEPVLHEWGLWSLLENQFEKVTWSPGKSHITPDDLVPILHDENLSIVNVSGPRYTVDTGYNKSTSGPKRAYIPANNGASVLESHVVPNFIVHVPGGNDNNLIAMETRKSDQQNKVRQVVKERARMVGYTSHPLDYQFALYLCIGVGDLSSCLYAICLPHRSLQQDYPEQKELDELRRQIGSCVERVCWSTKRSIVKPIEEEMVDIQRRFGFKEVTDDLLSDGFSGIPRDRIRFHVGS